MEITYLNYKKFLKTHHSIIPSFHHSNWGEAPNFVLLPPEIIVAYRIPSALFTIYPDRSR
jgi:hypothetical protein